MPENITDQQIRDLRTEAGQAGDRKMVATCDAALAGSPANRSECAQVIAEAQSMAAETETDTDTDTEMITVKVTWQKRRKAFDAAVYNCEWMGGTYDPATKTWAIPADRIADINRFAADGQIEIV